MAPNWLLISEMKLAFARTSSISTAAPVLAARSGCLTSPACHRLSAMPSRKKPEREHQLNVGDHIKVNLHQGRIVDATVKAIIQRTDGRHYQVDFGHEQTALIQEWQVVE